MTPLTDAELARLEELASEATPGPYNAFENSLRDDQGNQLAEFVRDNDDFVQDERDASYVAAACNAVPSLVPEVRRLREAKTISLCDIREQLESGQAETITALRERVEALEWLREVEAYQVTYDHPYCPRTHHDLTDEERQACINARAEHRLIEKAAREAVS